MNKRHLATCLSEVKIYNIPSIPLDKLFLRKSIQNDCIIKDKLNRAPLSIIKRAFHSTFAGFEYKQKEGAKILFYLSDPVRKSNEVNFNKVVSTAPVADTLIERHCNGKFRLEGFYILFILIPIWLTQLMGKGLSAIEKYQIIKELTEVYYAQKFLTKIPCRKYNLLVTYYDCVFHECMLTLLFKKAGIKTATLQHGQFNAWREDTFVNCGLEFYSSPSDYHLCWNKFAQDEAMKCGWEKENLPIVGIMSNIGRGIERCVKPNNNTFGVVISHPSWEHENVEMIKAANILAKHLGMKYVLKLHPNYKEDYFEGLIDRKYYMGNVAKGIDTMQYTNSVDFTIVGSTSVFAEMVYFYHDILRYSTMLPSDKYRDIKQGSVFLSKEQIIDCHASLREDSKSELFDYLCESTDTGNLYKSFFSKFL